MWGLGLAYAVEGSNLEVYHTDDLGSVRAVTDTSGAVVQTYTTDEFGVPTQTLGPSTQPFQYTGEPRDASGLVFLRARYYEPAVGRFVSRDPHVGRIMRPASLHRYVYSNNEPTRYMDPRGLDPCTLPNIVECVPQAVRDYIDALTGMTADAFGPPYDVTRIVQIADVLPIAEACGVGGAVIGVRGGPIGVVAGAAGGYGRCQPVEEIVGTIALYATQLQIANSGCGPDVVAETSALNLANYRLDLGPVFGELPEIAAYVAGNELLKCGGVK